MARPPENPEKWMLDIPNECLAELLSHGVITGNLLGCGDYGCVFQTQRPSRVLKLTYQLSEAKAAEFIFANQIKHPALPLIFNTWKLGCYLYEDEYIKWPIYAIIREDLDDLPIKDLEWFEEVTIDVEDALLEGVGTPDYEDKVLERIQEVLAEQPGHSDDELVIEEITELGLFGLEKGFTLTDLLHSNFGIREDGQLVVRDLGSIRLID